MAQNSFQIRVAKNHVSLTFYFELNSVFLTPIRQKMGQKRGVRRRCL